MRLATILADGTPTTAIVTDDDRHIPVQAIDPSLPTGMRDLLTTHLDDLPALADEANDGARQAGVENPRFLPLLSDAHAVWCAILNYPTHVTEGNWEPPNFPGFFLRHAASLVGHSEPMVAPSITDTFDYEGELAIVIGKGGRSIPPERAFEHVAGFSCFNDGSVREWQRHTSQITAGKNFERTGGFGPYLVTLDAVPDIEKSRIRTRLNGEVVQDAHISDMIFPIERLVSYLSDLGELLPGDVVVSGTPGGVGARRDPPRFMHAGDVVEVEIEHVGTLTNPITSGARP